MRLEMGLLSTLALSGRTAPMHIYAHAELERLLKPWLDFFCAGSLFEVVFHALPGGGKSEMIYEDRSLEVWTVPLRHRLPCCGFIFREKPLLPHIRRDMIDTAGTLTKAADILMEKGAKSVRA